MRALRQSAATHPKEKTMIRVVAIVTAKPGRREEILTAFRAILPSVRAEQGCIEYGPTIDAEGFGPRQSKVGPDTFVVIETWADAEALKAHAVAAHMAAYGAKVKELIANLAIHYLSPV
jgi:quinol monooxygenase YgiN